jgi:hypothetical protein
MEFIFNRKNEDGSVSPEKVALERWTWGVIYRNGQELHQFGSEGDFHQFGEIEQDLVGMFTMYKPDDMTKRIDIVTHGNLQFFHFYVNLVLENDTLRKRAYCFGWKDKKTGATSYNYILPDDRIVAADHKIENLLEFNL